jgi:hypothetical protein
MEKSTVMINLTLLLLILLHLKCMLHTWSIQKVRGLGSLNLYFMYYWVIVFIPFRRNALVPPPFPLVEAPLKIVFLQAFEQRQFGCNRCHVPQMPPMQHQLALWKQEKIAGS